MKCDVCQTTIPLGHDECPNCGFKVKKIKGIKSSTMDFDHIDDSYPTPYFDHIVVKRPKQIKESSNNQSNILMVLIPFFLIGIISSIMYFVIKVNNNLINFNFFNQIGGTYSFNTSIDEGCFDDYNFDGTEIIEKNEQLSGIIQQYYTGVLENDAGINITDNQVESYFIRYKTDQNWALVYDKDLCISQGFVQNITDEDMNQFFNENLINDLLAYEYDYKFPDQYFQSTVIPIIKSHNTFFDSQNGLSIKAKLEGDYMEFSVNASW